MMKYQKIYVCQIYDSNELIAIFEKFFANLLIFNRNKSCE